MGAKIEGIRLKVHEVEHTLEQAEAKLEALNQNKFSSKRVGEIHKVI